MASWAVLTVIEPSWVRVLPDNVDAIDRVPTKRRATLRVSEGGLHAGLTRRRGDRIRDGKVGEWHVSTFAAGRRHVRSGGMNGLFGDTARPTLRIQLGLVVIAWTLYRRVLMFGAGDHVPYVGPGQVGSGCDRNAMAAIFALAPPIVQRSSQLEVAFGLSLETCVLKARLFGGFLAGGNIFLHAALLIRPQKDEFMTDNGARQRAESVFNREQRREREIDAAMDLKRHATKPRWKT